MIPGMELMSCPVAVPASVMHHVVRVESSFNPYAIGVVGGRLLRQPKTLAEALATVRMLEGRGYNFSLGLAQVNRYNLAKYGLDSYEKAFQQCPNLLAGSRILAECHSRSGGDWGKSFSCYYSGNFTTGFRHGYVQKIYASMQGAARSAGLAIPVIAQTAQAQQGSARAYAAMPARDILSERIVATAPPVQQSVNPAATNAMQATAPAQPLPASSAMAIPQSAAPAAVPQPVAIAYPANRPVAQAVLAGAGQSTSAVPATRAGDSAFVF